MLVGDLFSGGGGSSIGAVAAGCTVAWAVESNHDAADCYERNLGAHVIRRPLQDIDPRTLHTVDVLLASPPCPAFSTARSKKLAPRDDGWLGLAVIPYIETLLPRVFILENVPPYLTAGWPILSQIIGALWRLGYTVDWSIENAANYGVPQTRSRLFVQAVRGALLPALPAPVPWIGWYAAIADLIPTLPESRLAPWQVERLSRHPIYGSVLCGTFSHSSGTAMRPADAPAFTLGAMANPVRAVLVDGQNAGREAMTVRGEKQPAYALTNGAKAMPRALLTSGGGTDRRAGDPEPGVVVRGADDPNVTITSGAGRMRALLIHPTSMERFPVRTGREPSYTITTTHAVPKALLVSGTDARVRTAQEPSCTLTASSHSIWPRAVIEARVVSLTVRALARLQSFPDTYIFPDSRAVSARIIGNAVCPTVMENLLKPLISAGKEEVP